MPACARSLRALVFAIAQPLVVRTRRSRELNCSISARPASGAETAHLRSGLRDRGDTVSRARSTHNGRSLPVRGNQDAFRLNLAHAGRSAGVSSGETPPMNPNGASSAPVMCLTVRVCSFESVPSFETSDRTTSGAESLRWNRALLYPTNFIGYSDSVRIDAAIVN